jgi:hypothetical protein
MAATTTSGAETPAASTPKRFRRGQQAISMARIESAEFKRRIWRACPEAGTPYETILTEAYWVHRAREFRAGDRIEVLPDEMHYFAELLVIAAGANWVRVIELFRKELQPEEFVNRSDYTVAWRGAHRKFAIVRTVDGAIVRDGFVQQHEAEAAIAQVRSNVG